MNGATYNTLAEMLTHKEPFFRRFAKKVFSYKRWGFEVKGRINSYSFIEAGLQRDYFYILWPAFDHYRRWRISVLKLTDENRSGKYFDEIDTKSGKQQDKDIFRAFEEPTWVYEGVSLRKMVYESI